MCCICSLLPLPKLPSQQFWPFASFADASVQPFADAPVPSFADILGPKASSSRVVWQLHNILCNLEHQCQYNLQSHLITFLATCVSILCFNMHIFPNSLKHVARTFLEENYRLPLVLPSFADTFASQLSERHLNRLPDKPCAVWRHT